MSFFFLLNVLPVFPDHCYSIILRNRLQNLKRKGYELCFVPRKEVWIRNPRKKYLVFCTPKQAFAKGILIHFVALLRPAKNDTFIIIHFLLDTSHRNGDVVITACYYYLGLVQYLFHKGNRADFSSDKTMISSW